MTDASSSNGQSNSSVRASYALMCGTKLVGVVLSGAMCGVILWLAAHWLMVTDIAGVAEGAGAEKRIGIASYASEFATLLLLVVVCICPIALAVGIVCAFNDHFSGRVIAKLGTGAVSGTLTGALSCGLLFVCLTMSPVTGAELIRPLSSAFVLGFCTGLVPGCIVGLLCASLEGVAMRSPLKAVFWAILAFISLALVAASIDVVRSLKAREELQIRRGQAVVQPNHSSRALIDGLRPLPHLVYAAQAANASRSASKRAIAFPLVDDTVMLA